MGSRTTGKSGSVPSQSWRTNSSKTANCDTRIAALLIAQSGGLDAYGGHHNRKAGGYHFHRGPLAGQSFVTKGRCAGCIVEVVGAHQQRGTPAGAGVGSINPNSKNGRYT